MPNSPTDICRLCHHEKPLQLSHIIPRFVTKWLVESGTGYLRSAGNPNRRSRDPDSYKREFLCRECEDRFNPSETWFASTVFHPYLRRERTTHVEHEGQLLYFVVSVLWRVIASNLEDRDVGSAFIESAKAAAETWRRYLLEGDDLGEFDQVHCFRVS